MQVFQVESSRDGWVESPGPEFPGPIIDWGKLSESVFFFLNTELPRNNISPVWFALTQDEVRTIQLNLVSNMQSGSLARIEAELRKQVCEKLLTNHGLHSTVTRISRRSPSAREGDDLCPAIKLIP